MLSPENKIQRWFLEPRAIKEELGDNDDEDDLATLERKMQSAGMPQSLQQPGYKSSQVYLELLADLPWQRTSEEIELDLRAAQKRLNSDHYGLVKVGQWIIEYLAVRKVVIHLCNGSCVVLRWTTRCWENIIGIFHCFCLGQKFMCISLGGITMMLILEDIGEHMLEAWPGLLIDGLKVKLQ
ncbi:hypothetical protein CR513_48014, partial [Mucuna pruriens]